MRANADAFFSIGKTHAVCQDYARAWLGEDGSPFAALSDGCSSSPDTDFGARFLVAAAMRLRPLAPLPRVPAVLVTEASIAARLMGLHPHCIDATLLVASRNHHGEPEGLTVSLRGDGVVAARHRNGGTWICTVNHRLGAPTYPSYALNSKRQEGYVETYGLELDYETFRSGAIDNDPAKAGPCDWRFPAAEWDLVLLMSDGVQSFHRTVATDTSRTREPVGVEFVVAELLAIKSTAGVFLQRRCKAFLSRFCAENGWEHDDDFSAAAIWVGS